MTWQSWRTINHEGGRPVSRAHPHYRCSQPSLVPAAPRAACARRAPASRRPLILLPCRVRRTQLRADPTRKRVRGRPCARLRADGRCGADLGPIIAAVATRGGGVRVRRRRLRLRRRGASSDVTLLLDWREEISSHETRCFARSTLNVRRMMSVWSLAPLPPRIPRGAHRFARCDGRPARRRARGRGVRERRRVRRRQGLARRQREGP